MKTKLALAWKFLKAEVWPVWNSNWFNRLYVIWTLLWGLYQVCIGEVGWGLIMWAILIFWTIMMVSGRLTEELLEDNSRILETAAKMADVAQYDRDRLAAVLALIKQYEATGKYAIPTDVLTTEINRVPVPTDIILRMMLKEQEK